MNALANPEYDFRTPEGISIDTGVPIEEVSRVHADNADLLRGPLIQPVDGSTIYTLADRDPSWRERYLQVRAYLSEHIATW
jgi:hypothetical protein